jgi:hypothetical protein
MHVSDHVGKNANEAASALCARKYAIGEGTAFDRRPKEPALKRPVLILVHGTGAGTADKVEPHWWQKESKIAQELAAAYPDGPSDLDPFIWSGRNSERDRRAAGRELLKRLRRYESENRAYHLIGHSHGGSVIWHALTEAARGLRLKNLGGWITVGTPFLQFRPAWAYLGIVLAVAAAFFVAWSATQMMLEAWPDRILVVRHAAIFEPIYGLIVRGLLTFVLTLTILFPFAASVGRFARGFPALSQMSPPLQIGGGLVLIGIISGGVWELLAWSDLVRLHGAKVGLWMTLALLASTWMTAAFCVAATVLLVYRCLEQRRRDELERNAAKLYGALWQPFTHAFDETVAGLAATRVSPYPVAAPRLPPDASVWRKLMALAVAPLARVADDFIWWMLMRRLQGADIWGLLLVDAAPAPDAVALAFGFESLTDPAAKALLEDAAKGLGELGTDLREKLVEAAAVPDAASAVEIVASAIKWTEVVHTLYFRDVRVTGMLSAALTATPRVPLPATTVAGKPHRAYAFAPLTLAACIVSLVAVWALGRLVQAFHAAYVQPNLAVTQVDAAADAWRRVSAMAVDRSPIAGEYLVRLMALGRLPDPIRALRQIPEEESYGAAAQRLAFAYGFAGDANKHAQLAQRFVGDPEMSLSRRRATAVHTLAGFVAAGREPPEDLVKTVLVLLRNETPVMGMRATLCAAIPALFAAGKQSDAMRLFDKLGTLRGQGCDEALDPLERRRKTQPPCTTHERIAYATAKLGAWQNAQEIVRKCDNSNRSKILFLRLALQIEDPAVASEYYNRLHVRRVLRWRARSYYGLLSWSKSAGSMKHGRWRNRFSPTPRPRLNQSWRSRYALYSKHC